jgi:hypothetical protein
MKTNNAVAHYIATRGVTKHMSRTEAAHVWGDLKLEGWTKDGIMLVKNDEEGTQRFLTFTKVNEHKVSVSYMELEVAQ